MDPVEITAGSLHLRPLGSPVAELVPSIVAVSQDPLTVRWTLVPTPYSACDAVAFLAACSADWAAGAAGHWAVLASVGGDYLGSVSIRGLSGIGDVGCVAAPSARGRGVIPAAVRAAAGWAFFAGLARLEWYSDPANTSSQQAARRAGFAFEGVLRSRLVHRDGSRYDGWLASLLPGDL